MICIRVGTSLKCFCLYIYMFCWLKKKIVGYDVDNFYQNKKHHPHCHQAKTMNMNKQFECIELRLYFHFLIVFVNLFSLIIIKYHIMFSLSGIFLYTILNLWIEKMELERKTSP